MSDEAITLPDRGVGLLRAGRTRSYGSLVRSPISPVRQRRVEHRIQPGETLQGLALKYGVSMEQIKRANRMYTNDSIHLKKSLSIPLLLDSSGSLEVLLDDGGGGGGDQAAGKVRSGQSSSDRKQNDDAVGTSEDLSPKEFLKRLDGLIHQSKQAAARGCQDAEKRFAAVEEVCSGETPAWRPLVRSRSAGSSSRGQQLAAHGAVPLTITRLTKNLRDREDEIFQL